MPSQKKRINLTVNDAIYTALKILSKNRDLKISTVSLNLVQKALELEEDMYFSTISDKRLSQKKKIISHKKAWK